MPHATPELPPTALDVSDLTGSPGATRQVELDVPVPPGFEVPLTRFGPSDREERGDDAAVAVDGVLESLVDGVLLRGTVAVDVQQQCALCLTDLPTARVTAEVAELFAQPDPDADPADAEPGYEIADDRIDIDAMIRDALAEQVADAPRCRPDCAGLCPTCGADRNTVDCDCADQVADPRWAALADLDVNP